MEKKWIDYIPFTNRRGASTTDYVVVLVGVLVLGLVLYHFVLDGGQTTIKDKIIAIINGEEVGGTKLFGGSAEDKGVSDSGNQQEKVPPKREQAQMMDEVEISDRDLRLMSEIVYADQYGGDMSQLQDRDFDDIFGYDDNGNSNAEIIGTEDLWNGFEAVAVKNKATGEIVVSFRGSDTHKGLNDWWGQDFTILTQYPGLQEGQAKKFVEKIKNNPKAKDSSIVLTGHSLGGWHAQMAAKETGLPAVTFNAPGVKPNTVASLSPKSKVKSLFNPRMNIIDDISNVFGANDDQVINYVDGNDFIGNFGIHYGRTIVTGSGKEPNERNDYLRPDQVGGGGAVSRGVRNYQQGGANQIAEPHKLDSFDDQFGADGNIHR